MPHLLIFSVTLDLIVGSDSYCISAFFRLQSYGNIVDILSINYPITWCPVFKDKVLVVPQCRSESELAFHRVGQFHGVCSGQLFFPVGGEVSCLLPFNCHTSFTAECNWAKKLNIQSPCSRTYRLSHVPVTYLPHADILSSL